MKRLRFLTCQVFYLYLVISYVQCYNSEKLNKYRMRCMEKLHINTDLILTIRAGNWDINDDAVRRWALCILSMAGVMSKQGVFRINEALEGVPKEEQDAALARADRCLLTKRATPEKIAWHYLKCMNEENPKEFTIL